MNVHSLLFTPSPSALEDEDDDEGHTVVATARGIFNSNGGVLSSIETGVSIIIPQGAIPEGVEQEIYFKVCRDNSILPPLDKEKGVYRHPVGCGLVLHVMCLFKDVMSGRRSYVMEPCILPHGYHLLDYRSLLQFSAIL